MLDIRSLDVQAVSSADPSSRLSPATKLVAVVAPDDLVVHRIREALSSDAIALGARARDVAGLRDDAAQAVAMVLVGRAGGARKCKALVRAATARLPRVPVVLIAPLSATGSTGCSTRAWQGSSSTLSWNPRSRPRFGQFGPVSLSRRATSAARWFGRPCHTGRGQTLALVVMALINRQIAGRLFLAKSTVKTHLTSIFSKLGMGSRSEAVALVLDAEQKFGLGILGLPLGASPAATAEEARS